MNSISKCNQTKLNDILEALRTWILFRSPHTLLSITLTTHTWKVHFIEILVRAARNIFTQLSTNFSQNFFFINLSKIIFSLQGSRSWDIQVVSESLLWWHRSVPRPSGKMMPRLLNTQCEYLQSRLTRKRRNSTMIFRSFLNIF